MQQNIGAEAILPVTETATLFQRYDILEMLFNGESTAVYSCMDRFSGKTLAFKVLQPALANCSEAIFALEAEFRTAYKVQHVHAVQVHDFLRDEETAGYCMDYVDGWTLAALNEAAGPQRVMMVVNLIAQLAEVLDAMHRRGICHHGVEAENVLLGRDMKARICDFGSTRLREGSNLHDLQKAAYRSPELLNGQAADHRSDIYSLGVLAYKTLTGQFPHALSTFREHLKSKKRGSTPIEEYRNDCTWGLKECINWMLEPNPAARPQNVKEVLDYLYQLHPKPRAQQLNVFGRAKLRKKGEATRTNFRKSLLTKLPDLSPLFALFGLIPRAVRKGIRLEHKSSCLLPPTEA